MSPNNPLNSAPNRTALPLALLFIAWTGGSTDAICYGGLGHVFAANMTGHTVLLALSLSGEAGLSFARGMASLVSFLCGVAIGAYVIRAIGSTHNKFRSMLPALIVEAVILIAFAAGWCLFSARSDWQVYLLIILSGLAMGVQSAAVLNLAIPGVTTTYITGMYTQLVCNLVFLFPDRSSTPSADSTARSFTAEIRQRTGVALPISILIVYGLGAIAGGWSLLGSRWLAPAVPLAGFVGTGLTLHSACLPNHSPTA